MAKKPTDTATPSTPREPRVELTDEQKAAKVAEASARLAARRDRESAFARIGVAQANGQPAAIVQAVAAKGKCLVTLETTYETLGHIDAMRGKVVALVVVDDPIAAAKARAAGVLDGSAPTAPKPGDRADGSNIFDGKPAPGSVNTGAPAASEGEAQ